MSQKKRLAGPLKWYGGKHKLVKKLLPLIPEHQTYVEAFAGGASLLFAKPVSPLEVINDIDSGIVNFYRVLRDPAKFERFKSLVSLTPFSREEYHHFRETWKDTGDEVERAYRWFVVARMCFSGAFGSGFAGSITSGRNGMAVSHASFRSAIDRLPEISDRLLRVQIEHLDFRELIEKYDRTGTFFYLDPPYVSSTRKSKSVYTHEMTDEDHEDLVELLLGIKGKAVLSGYVNDIYAPLECKGWKRIDFPTKAWGAPVALRDDLTDSGLESGKGSRVDSVWCSPQRDQSRIVETSPRSSPKPLVRSLCDLPRQEVQH